MRVLHDPQHIAERVDDGRRDEAVPALVDRVVSRAPLAMRSANAAATSLRGRGPTVDADTLTAIASATRDREQLRFDYLDHNGATTRRTAEPHRLVYTGHRWYLLAWDVDRGTSALAWPHRARVQLHAPAAEIAERIPSYAGILVPIDADNAILETGADSLRYIALLLCGLDMPFTVLEPPELCDELKTLAERLTSAAESTAPRPPPA